VHYQLDGCYAVCLLFHPPWLQCCFASSQLCSLLLHYCSAAGLASSLFVRLAGVKRCIREQAFIFSYPLCVAQDSNRPGEQQCWQMSTPQAVR
jgi:hypothetical protein